MSIKLKGCANPGVGDMTISGGATFINARKTWRTP